MSDAYRLYFKCPKTGREHDGMIVMGSGNIRMEDCRVGCPSCGEYHVLWDEAEAFWRKEEHGPG